MCNKPKGHNKVLEIKAEEIPTSMALAKSLLLSAKPEIFMSQKDFAALAGRGKSSTVAEGKWVDVLVIDEMSLRWMSFKKFSARMKHIAEPIKDKEVNEVNMKFDMIFKANVIRLDVVIAFGHPRSLG